MTKEEQDALIADMVRERRELNRTIGCLESMLDRAYRSLGAARLAVGNATGENPRQPPEDLDYPPPEKLCEWLGDLRDARDRLAAVNARLDRI